MSPHILLNKIAYKIVFKNTSSFPPSLIYVYMCEVYQSCAVLMYMNDVASVKFFFKALTYVASSFPGVSLCDDIMQKIMTMFNL